MQNSYLNRLFISFFIICSLFNYTKAQWKLLKGGTTFNLTSVAAIDSNSAIAIGKNGIILKTTDNGISWNKIDLGINNNLNDISCKIPNSSSSNFITIGGDKIILMSSDRGKTWTKKDALYNFTTVDHGYPSIYLDPFMSDSSIILGSEDGRIVYSLNEGKSWIDTLLFNSKIISASFNIVDFLYGTGLIASAVSNSEFASGEIIFNTWKKFYIGTFIPWQNVASGEIASHYQYLVGNGGELVSVPLLLRKTQQDSTWTDISKNLSVGLFPNKIRNLRAGLFICDLYGKIVRSDNNGDSWIEQQTPVDISLNDISFYDSEKGYAVGDSGTILYTDNGGVTGVEKNSNKNPSSFKLYQNFPNPFNPSTKIKYSIPVVTKYSVSVKLKVYDILGNEIANLVNEYKSPGAYEVEFNTNVGTNNNSPLPSGIYFYQLKVGNYVQTKKMVLLK